VTASQSIMITGYLGVEISSTAPSVPLRVTPPSAERLKQGVVKTIISLRGLCARIKHPYIRVHLKSYHLLSSCRAPLIGLKHHVGGACGAKTEIGVGVKGALQLLSLSLHRAARFACCLSRCRFFD